MGRMIDADDFLQNLIHYRIGRQSLEEVIKAVNAQPTVYDVEAVAEQISRSAFERNENLGMGGEKVVNLDDAIEIVKGGGVDAKTDS